MRLFLASRARVRVPSVFALALYIVALSMGGLGHRHFAAPAPTPEPRGQHVDRHHAGADHGCVICTWLLTTESTGPAATPTLKVRAALRPTAPQAILLAATLAPLVVTSRGPPVS